MTYLLYILTSLSVYVLLAASLNVMVGYVGLVALSQAAFLGIGAYVSTLLMIDAGLPYWLAAVIAPVIAALLSLIIAIPSLRLTGDYFILASLSFQMIVFNALQNWVSLTRGPYGISEIPRPQILGRAFNDPGSYFIYAATWVSILLGVLYWMGRSPFGRVLKSIREDEVAAAALGRDTPRIKVTAFAVSAMFAAMAGVLFAGINQYIDPTSFTLAESISVLSMLIVGGAGNFRGPVLGCALVLLLPEALRLLAVSDSVAANLRQILNGLAIILILRFRPQGVAGEFRFE
jgi:branched-chain amino acid transport system permease protein